MKIITINDDDEIDITGKRILVHSSRENNFRLISYIIYHSQKTNVYVCTTEYSRLQEQSFWDGYGYDVNYICDLTRDNDTNIIKKIQENEYENHLIIFDKIFPTDKLKIFIEMFKTDNISIMWSNVDVKLSEIDYFITDFTMKTTISEVIISHPLITKNIYEHTNIISPHDKQILYFMKPNKCLIGHLKQRDSDHLCGIFSIHTHNDCGYGILRHITVGELVRYKNNYYNRKKLSIEDKCETCTIQPIHNDGKMILFVVNGDCINDIELETEEPNIDKISKIVIHIRDTEELCHLDKNLIQYNYLTSGKILDTHLMSFDKPLPLFMSSCTDRPIVVRVYCSEKIDMIMKINKSDVDLVKFKPDKSLMIQCFLLNYINYNTNKIIDLSNIPTTPLYIIIHFDNFEDLLDDVTLSLIYDVGTYDNKLLTKELPEKYGLKTLPDGKVYYFMPFTDVKQFKNRTYHRPMCMFRRIMGPPKLLLKFKNKEQKPVDVYVHFETLNCLAFSDGVVTKMEQ